MVVAIVVALCSTSAFAQEPAESAETLTETEVIARVTGALDRSLEYLYAQQRPDGGWDNNHAPNALALLSFMGRGHVPGRGPYRDTLERGKKYILATQSDAGLFVSVRPSHGPMYEHALATLAMAEMYGMDADPDLEERLRRAVNLIVSAQSPSGGWRYQPQPGSQDLSVSVMQIVALRAANNAEVPVPQETIDKAVQYVRSCGAATGGFGYEGPSPNPQMTAAGILSMQLLGQYEDPSVELSLNYLANVPVDWSNQTGVSYFYYFHYYAMQSHYQAGGEHWNRWHPQVRELLLNHQNEDGSWDVPAGTAEQDAGTVGANKVYWTSMASLVLEVYMHFLPAYQR